MTPNTKSRTAALPKINKNLLNVGQGAAKTGASSETIESAWTGMVFGPYLVPLGRRVE
jgi:hypothetical protein